MSLVKSTLSITAASLVYVVSSYLANLWLGRTLGPEQYGTYGVVLSVWTIINLVLTAGIPSAVSKFIASDSNKTNEILKSGLILQFICTLLISLLYWLLSPSISKIFNDEGLIPYFRISALIIPTYSIYSFFVGYYNGMHNFPRQTILNIVFAVSKVVAIISFAYFLGIRGAFIGFAIAPLVALAFGFRLPSSTSVHFPYKTLIRFSLPLIGFAVFLTFLQTTDLYLVKIFTTDKNAAGYYTAIQNIAIIPFYLLGSISQIIFPSISKSSVKTDQRETSQMITRTMRYIFIILIPLSSVISASSGDLITLLYSTQYLPASSALGILTWSYASITVFSILSNIVNGSGHPYKSMITSIIGVLIISLLCFILIPRFGLVGAATATLIGSLTSAFISGIIVYSKYKLTLPILSILKVTTASLILFIVIKVINYIPLSYIMSLGIYIVILFISKEFSKADWDLAMSLLPWRTKK
jgi:stage V sporulation protein B